jgi:excisionase family DNA binding protein
VTSSCALIGADEPLLTVAQVAKRLQLSPRTVWRMVNDKRLPVLRFGRSVRVHPDALTALIKQS